MSDINAHMRIKCYIARSDVIHTLQSSLFALKEANFVGVFLQVSSSVLHMAKKCSLALTS